MRPEPRARLGRARHRQGPLLSAGFDLSIVDLGLVCSLSVEDDAIAVEMTFTEPGCPFTHRVVVDMEESLRAAGFRSVSIRPVWDPIWTEEALDDTARQAFAAARGCMARSSPRRQAERPR